MLYLERWKLLQAARTLPAGSWLSGFLHPATPPGANGARDGGAGPSAVPVAVVALTRLGIQIRHVVNRCEAVLEEECARPSCRHCGGALGDTDACAGCAEFRDQNSIF